MSDVATTKRGNRKSAAPVEKKEVESKKRSRKDVKAADGGGDSGDGASPAKRGRGRPPKGSKKRKAVPKSKGGKSGPGLRGRPRKEDKKEDNSEEDGEENDAGEEDDE